MFNEDTKALFLNQLPTDALRRIYTSIFSRTRKFEEHVNKDIYNLNKDECMDLIFYLSPKSINAVGVYRSQFIKYTDWALRHDLVTEKCNYWTLLPIDEEFARESFKRRYIKDIDHLESVVETTLEAIYDKYVVYLLYMGIMGDEFDELCTILDSDVNTLEGTIKTKRRFYPKIVQPLHDLLKNPPYFTEKKKRDESSPYLVKPFLTKHLEGSPAGLQYIYRVFLKLNNSKERKIYTPLTIWRSGLFHKLYTIERPKASLMKDDFLYACTEYGKDVTDNAGAIGQLWKEYDLYKDIFWGK